jgi:hypothetical protein
MRRRRRRFLQILASLFVRDLEHFFSGVTRCDNHSPDERRVLLVGQYFDPEVKRDIGFAAPSFPCSTNVGRVD